MVRLIFEQPALMSTVFFVSAFDFHVKWTFEQRRQPQKEMFQYLCCKRQRNVRVTRRQRNVTVNDDLTSLFTKMSILRWKIYRKMHHLGHWLGLHKWPVVTLARWSRAGRLIFCHRGKFAIFDWFWWAKRRRRCWNRCRWLSFGCRRRPALVGWQRGTKRRSRAESQSIRRNSIPGPKP